MTNQKTKRFQEQSQRRRVVTAVIRERCEHAVRKWLEFPQEALRPDFLMTFLSFFFFFFLGAAVNEAECKLEQCSKRKNLVLILF